MQYGSYTPQRHLLSSLVGFYMHDDMIKILELFLKLGPIFNTQGLAYTRIITERIITRIKVE
jgi:hypothetical protein